MAERRVVQGLSLLHEYLVDAVAVHVHYLEEESSPFETVARRRNTPELIYTSWSEARLEGTRDGEEIVGAITPPEDEEEALGFEFSVVVREEGEDHWRVVTTDDGQPKINVAKIVGN